MAALKGERSKDAQTEPKYRHELKYLCSEAELEVLRVRLNDVMRADPHADSGGRYQIRSVYFDDIENSCYYENENGVSPREKWRVRIYNQSAERIMLECKRKESGMIQKKMCPLTKRQYERLMRPYGDMSGDGQPDAGNLPLYNRFLLLQRVRGLRPVVIVQYERRPFVCAAGNVRVTFDCGITSSTDFAHFFAPSLIGRPVLPTGRQLLEVKYDEYLPDYIYHAVQLTSMRQETFSKYYLCRRHAFYKKGGLL